MSLTTRVLIGLVAGFVLGLALSNHYAEHREEQVRHWK